MKLTKEQKAAAILATRCFGLVALSELAGLRVEGVTDISPKRVERIALKMRMSTTYYHKDMLVLIRCLTLGEMTDDASDALADSGLMALLKKSWRGE